MNNNLIFTAYQAQGQWKMIIRQSKAQLYKNNVKKSQQNSAWHKYLHFSQPCAFILQNMNKPSNRFFRNVLFAATIILIFGGLFPYCLYWIYQVKCK